MKALFTKYNKKLIIICKIKLICGQSQKSQCRQLKEFVPNFIFNSKFYYVFLVKLLNKILADKSNVIMFYKKKFKNFDTYNVLDGYNPTLKISFDKHLYICVGQVILYLVL